MKKITKLLLTGVALMGVALSVAGCSSKQADDNSGGTKTLTMYQIGEKPKNYDTLIKKANKTIEKKYNAKLKINYIGYGDYAQKMAVIVSSGEAYDIAKADNYTLNAQKGAYADLTELLPKYASKAYKNLDSAYIKGNKVNGKLYALPVNANVSTTETIAFNKYYLDKYDIDISKVSSYSDLESALKKFHANEPNVVGFAAVKGFKSAADFDYPLSSRLPFAVDTSSNGDPTKIVNQYNSAQMLENLEALHSYYKKGYIAQDAATSTKEYLLDSKTWFARQEAQGPYDYGDQALNTAAGSKDAIVTKEITTPLKATGNAQMFNWVVGNASKNKTLSVKVLGLLNSDPDLLNGLVWGEEGKAWEKTGDADKIKLLPGYKADESMGAWMTGNNQILYTTTDVTDKEIATRDNTIKTAKESPILGFNPDTSKIKTQITNIQNVMDQYGDILNTGTAEPKATIKQMNKALKSAGYAEVQKELQTQYDKFLKAQK
ncbi:ABC transporter substrate-binding protein [Pediococcus inopinatus]|uniref:ABC transporter substrate-binding protein n=1 Tax=Pediococcus inopinatus TaxID=114090 RepID=A0ABZ0Q3R8_9LACO|nr:ABC transporter substrate-binding protein [Pediococcus inopinatus]WPC19925.1 ABC transporter substrate-binding protein [Pediococcus inopinatus]WPC21625.1 ABC transporter substrate-binding protein [Pediococcus inopinatus]WPP09443.1 ABC transporter substrate-binding protein [Pediococcus inopinatus]